MLEEDVGVVPVVEADGRLWGIVTDRDIIVRGLVKGRSIETCTAADVATTNIEVASTHDSLSEVIELMGRERIRRVPVLDDDDKLVGILALADIASRADYREDLQQAFQKISGRRSFWSRIWR
jgi:CBS domain-containing protein